jgi:Icc protein
VREAVRELAARSEHLTYLPAAGVISLGDETALVGHGGWGDGRLGDFENSWVILNDFFLIEELTGLPPADLLRRLNALGDEAGAYLAETLPFAFAAHRRVIVLTHVPPFKETCWHEGQISDDNFLPHFTCKAVGDALLRATARQPDEKEMLVLCGHTHGAGETHIRHNLRVLTGGAEYGAPAIQRLFDVE